MFARIIAVAALAAASAASAQMGQTTSPSSQSGTSQSGSAQSGSMSSSTAAGGGMSEDQIRTSLTNGGYTQVTGLTRSGAGWKGSAMKDGKKVPVWIDQNGTVSTGKAPRG